MKKLTHPLPHRPGQTETRRQRFHARSPRSTADRAAEIARDIATFRRDLEAAVGSKRAEEIVAHLIGTLENLVRNTEDLCQELDTARPKRLN